MKLYIRKSYASRKQSYAVAVKTELEELGLTTQGVNWDEVFYFLDQGVSAKEAAARLAGAK